MTLTQADAAGNVSPLARPPHRHHRARRPDRRHQRDGQRRDRTGEAGATVTIRDPGGTVLGTAIVASNGSYAVTLTPAQLNAQLLQVSQADAAGNVLDPPPSLRRT